MTDIVERLRQQVGDDHTRGCIQGRCYTCDCGYDEKTELLLEEAGAEIERLRAALMEISAEVLPELRASELELIVWWGRQVDRLQAIARGALTSTDSNTTENIEGGAA